MVINNFDIISVAFAPGEADPPLVVDSDAPLPFSIAVQFLESITRRYSEILDLGCSIEHPKLPERRSWDGSFRDRCRLKSFSASASAQLRIIERYDNASR
jgi:hypothetical protein